MEGSKSSRSSLPYIFRGGITPALVQKKKKVGSCHCLKVSLGTSSWETEKKGKNWVPGEEKEVERKGSLCGSGKCTIKKMGRTENLPERTNFQRKVGKQKKTRRYDGSATDRGGHQFTEGRGAPSPSRPKVNHPPEGRSNYIREDREPGAPHTTSFKNTNQNLVAQVISGLKMEKSKQKSPSTNSKTNSSR